MHKFTGRTGVPSSFSGTASRTAPTSHLSCVLAADRTTEIGTPRASVMRCRFTPNFPRSVGFLPVRSPLLAPLPRRCRWKPSSTGSLSFYDSEPAVLRRSDRRPRLHSIAEAEGGRSSLIQTLEAVPSTGSRSAAGKQCPRGPRGRGLEGGLLVASEAPWEAGAQFSPRGHQGCQQTWGPSQAVDQERDPRSRGFRIGSKAPPGRPPLPEWFDESERVNRRHAHPVGAKKTRRLVGTNRRACVQIIERSSVRAGSRGRSAT